jgi:hypothetical protein
MIIDFSKYAQASSNEIEEKKAIFAVVIVPEVEDTIKAAGLNPACFTLNSASEQEFFRKPFIYTEPDDAFGEVYYDLVRSDTIYRCVCRIKLTEGGNKIWDETDIFRLQNYKTGNREWEYFTGDDWGLGPGDIFDISDFEIK